LPAIAWPELAGGGWTRLSWEGSWFGQPVTGSLRTESPDRKSDKVEPLEFNLASGDEVELRLSLTHGQPWGEERLFAEHLARVFVLLLETRLHARTEALSAALAERARLSLYLQHDMRNLAQWALWVSDDFASCETPEKMLAAGRRLRDNAPLAKDRAERLIGALGKTPAVELPAKTDLREAIFHAARLAGAEAKIDGEAVAWIAPGLLARALANLFGNLAAAWRDKVDASPSLLLRTRTDSKPAMAELEFFCPWPPDVVPLAPEKIFEPFASGRPRGLGLGLYQARKSLREAGGDLKAEASPEGLRFLLSLRAQAP
ncbi:MAG: hypothetical protein K9J42_01210, partial [Sulfuritalea sp.]|nr:hypothetical protein [Sulfuritalea sp.]